MISNSLIYHVVVIIRLYKYTVVVRFCISSNRARGLPLRSKNMAAVAGLFSHIGEMQVVHHFWGESASDLFHLPFDGKLQ